MREHDYLKLENSCVGGGMVGNGNLPVRPAQFYEFFLNVAFIIFMSFGRDVFQSSPAEFFMNLQVNFINCSAV